MAPAARIKVVHLITLLEFGGAQGNTIHTVQNLDPAEFDAELWAGKGAYWDKEVGARTRYFSTLVRPLNPLFDFLAVIELWFALRKTRPQILHTHSSKAGIVGRIAGALSGVPLIIHTFHGFGFNDRQKPWTRALFVFLERFCARFTDTLVFVSQSNWDLAKKMEIGDESRYRLIHSGVPLNQIKMKAQESDPIQLRADFKIPSEAKIVSTIGAFKPQKNLFDFLAAAKKIAAALPHTYFFIIGDGELRADLENRIREWGLESRLYLPGWREDAVRFLAASDLFIMTSLWEGLPRALVEAMALGRPPICYDTDGVHDLLDSFGPLLVRQGEVNQVAEQAIRLLTDSGEWKRISERVRAAIGPEFDINVMVRQQEALYRERLKVDNPHLKH